MQTMHERKIGRELRGGRRGGREAGADHQCGDRPPSACRSCRADRVGVERRRREQNQHVEVEGVARRELRRHKQHRSQTGNAADDQRAQFEDPDPVRRRYRGRQPPPQRDAHHHQQHRRRHQ